MNHPETQPQHRKPHFLRNGISFAIAAACIALLSKDPEKESVKSSKDTGEVVTQRTPEQLYQYFSREFHARLKIGLEQKAKNWNHTTTQEQFRGDIDDLFMENNDWKELKGLLEAGVMSIERPYFRESPYMRCGIGFHVRGLPPSSSQIGRYSGWWFVDPKSGLSL